METTDLVIIFNLIILESLLSVDNAAVLAVMVRELPPKDQPKALKYGLLGAFVFRGIALVFASHLVAIKGLKILGGLYLLYLSIRHFSKGEKVETLNKEKKPKELPSLYRKVQNIIGAFWLTVILVELMDIVFSIDNVFAAVAMTDKLWLIMTGVFIGIVSMRFVAQRFVKLMERFPSLNESAFLVIGLLGAKLVGSGLIELLDNYWVHRLIALTEGMHLEIMFSITTMLIFFYPIAKERMKKSHTEITNYKS